MVGFNADQAGGKLPSDGQIQIAVDRLLAPDSVTRQSFALHDAVGNYFNPIITYDPVARVVSLASPNSPGATWLTAGTTYYVDVGVAKPGDDTGGSGPRAIDGATLATAVTKVFIAGPPAATPSEDRPIDFCNDVLPIFQNNCSGAPCHSGPSGGSRPPEGLILDAPLGLANTAVGRESQESNQGGPAGKFSPTAFPFGEDMAIINPGSPGTSWLMYKVLLAPGSPASSAPLTCGTMAAPIPVGQPTASNPAVTTVPLSDSERSVLASYMIGNQMPNPPVPPLGLDQLERIRAWIAQGANVVDCPACDYDGQ